MSQERENDALEGDQEDRISALPENVIDHILELLPARDAAKTSILSKKWKYIWLKLPYLVLDHRFCTWFIRKSQFFFEQTVDEILGLHLGDIVKFVLYVTEDHLASNDDVDRWMRRVTRDGIKELTLYLPADEEIHYEVPSCAFNCTTLTCLELSYCVFKPPNSFLGFPKLETLHLEGIIIVPATELCVLNVPLLVNLNLINCDGAEYLKIVAPQLEMLFVYEIHYLVLNYFMKCEKLRELELNLFNMVYNITHDERSTVEKLLFSVAPALEKLILSSHFLELLTAGTIAKGPLLMLNCLRILSLSVNFGKLSQTTVVLQLITSVPNLSKLEIDVVGIDDNADAILEYLSTQACTGQSLNKLKHVVICSFRCSKTELIFMKLLFARAPSLVRISIEDVRPGSSEERWITTESTSFPRASPNAQLYFSPR